MLPPLLLAFFIAAGFSFRLGACTQVPLNDLRLEKGGKVVDADLSSFIQNELQTNNVTGLSLTIVLPNGGGVEYAAWGDRTETGDPVTEETIMHLGSCSKAFLSASLGILMQDFADGKNQTALPPSVRKFDWDTKVRDLLPDEWMTEDPFGTEKATLKDLLAHRTGLPAHDGSYSPSDTPHNVVTKMRHLRAAYEFRERYEYNNQMYVTGAYVVSKYSGLAYRDFAEARILRPLSMKSSTLYPDRAFATGEFTESWTTFRRRIAFFMPESVAELIAGAGGVMSSGEDMAKWVKTLLNSGVDPTTNRTIIPRATFDLATSAITIAADRGSNLTSILGYGLGWGRSTYRGHELVSHNGGAPGVATIVDLYPNDGFGLIILANTAVHTVTRRVASAVADRILGLPSVRSSEEAKVETPAQTEATPVEPPTNVLAGFTGTYSDPGYGNFTLCSPLFPTSAECLAVVRDFRFVDSAAGRATDTSDLYAAWPRFWGTHLRLEHVTGNKYAFKLSTLYPDGYGLNGMPFEDLSNAAPAEFVVEDGAVVGLGVFVALKESWRMKEGGNVRDIADVWFKKL
ncbi:beta-lactamase domain-containing protein [Favolaschia claudopus]|uniref:Beta-lactamase domain-containing protein n=1 Tax=Favolaschia claudopus TaxID=2862362 RepID=A0AAW0BP58_9AGAR